MSGYGRHANAMLSCLAKEADVSLEILVSQEHLKENGQLDMRSPFSGFPLKTLPMRERYSENLWKTLAFPALDSYLKNVDIVYSPFATYLPVRSKPWLVTIHDVMAFETNLPWSKSIKHRWFRFKWAGWAKRAARDATYVLTSTEFSKDRIVYFLNVTPEKVIVVGNGIDPTFLNNAPTNMQYDLPFDAPYLLVVGGLTKHKGGEVVLKVAESLRERGSNLQIVVTGHRDAALAERAKQIPSIHLLPRVTDEQLRDLYTRALALLFMSWYEGFGIPPLEAMAVGTPVIVSDQASLPEVVGDAGMVVSPTDPRRAAEFAIQLERSSQLRSAFAQRGREHAATFGWDQCGERLMQVIRSLK